MKNLYRSCWISLTWLLLQPVSPVPSEILARPLFERLPHVPKRQQMSCFPSFPQTLRQHLVGHGLSAVESDQNSMSDALAVRATATVKGTRASPWCCVKVATIIGYGISSKKRFVAMIMSAPTRSVPQCVRVIPCPINLLQPFVPVTIFG